MKIRARLQGALENEPSMLVELRSAPAAGDLLDSQQYGPCEVVDILSTPSDRCQDAFALLQMRLPSDVRD